MLITTFPSHPKTDKHLLRYYHQALFHRTFIPGTKVCFCWQVNNKNFWKFQLCLNNGWLFLELFTCNLYGQCLKTFLFLIEGPFSQHLVHICYLEWARFGGLRIPKNESYMCLKHRYEVPRYKGKNSGWKHELEIEIQESSE